MSMSSSPSTGAIETSTTRNRDGSELAKAFERGLELKDGDDDRDGEGEGELEKPLLDALECQWPLDGLDYHILTTIL